MTYPSSMTVACLHKYPLVGSAKAIGTANRTQTNERQYVLFRKSSWARTIGFDASAVLTVKLLGPHGRHTSKRTEENLHNNHSRIAAPRQSTLKSNQAKTNRCEGINLVPSCSPISGSEAVPMPLRCWPTRLQRCVEASDRFPVHLQYRSVGDFV
jgi:hypothetical protein